MSKKGAMADQKQCPRLAQGPLLVSLVALPWVVNLVSPNKPDTALHLQDLSGSIQARGSSGGVSRNAPSCSNVLVVGGSSHALPNLERTAAVQGCLESQLHPSWASRKSVIPWETWISELSKHYKPEGQPRTTHKWTASPLGVSCPSDLSVCKESYLVIE